MAGPEEETYSIIFGSLRHPARRKILRLLSERAMTFSQMLETLAIPSSHLTYHLENLTDLVVKMDDGKYKLSSFGKASVSMMKGAEEVPDAESKRFSALPLRWKSLYAIMIIAIVLVASFSIVQYSSITKLSKDYKLLRSDYLNLKDENQRLLQWSSSADKAMTMIRNVIQIDASKYQATLLSDTVEDRADLGGVIEEVFKYSLVNSQSRFEITLRFRNNHFSLYQLTQLEGAPSYPLLYTQPQPIYFLDAARGLLNRYMQTINDSYAEEMSMLLATASGTNIEQSLGSTKLKTTIYGDNAQVILLYTNNGTDYSAKSVQMNFENYGLTDFSDNWFIYKIADAHLTVTKDQAVQIARNAVKGFSWNASGIKVTSFNVLDEPVSAVFFPHPRAEPLTLVPYWYITLYLDKNYPGEVNSIAIGVWADTGKVANIQALVNQVSP